MSSEITEIRVLNARLEAKLDAVLEGLKYHMEQTDKRFEAVDEKVDKLDGKWNSGIMVVLGTLALAVFNLFWDKALK